MTYHGLLALSTGDVTFTDETGCSYTLTMDERKLLIKVLKKEIPIKPILKTKNEHECFDSYNNTCNIVICGNCGKRLKLKSKGIYCDKCGQKIDWTEN